MPSALVLVINSGSSSLKFSLYYMHTGGEVVAGLAERLETPDGMLSWRNGGGDKLTLAMANQDHVGALRAMYERIKSLGVPKAVGHRVVHGGEAFSASVLIDEAVFEGIEQCASLAPLHKPANVLGINAMKYLNPQVPQVSAVSQALL